LAIAASFGVLPALSACGSRAAANSDGAGAGGTAGNNGSGAAGQGDRSQLVGAFQVKVTPASGDIAASTQVVGKVYDGPTPVTVVWENPQIDGPCTLTTPRVPFCSTPCGGSSACVEDDTCQAYASARSVGAVTVTGVKTTDGDSSFVMTAVANTYQAPSSVSLAYPPFAAGDAVRVSAAGDYFPAFTLTSTGVAPLALTSGALALRTGQPLALTWTKSATGNATVHVKLDISHHGGTKGQIECDADDSGSLTIKAPLITTLLGLGAAGYPTIIVSRHAIGSALISAGRVDLDVSSVAEQGVSVEGLTSCTEDSDCASGETCQSDLSCH
jgi:hypothetical protein